MSVVHFSNEWTFRIRLQHFGFEMTIWKIRFVQRKYCIKTKKKHLPVKFNLTKPLFNHFVKKDVFQRSEYQKSLCKKGPFQR